MRKITIDGKEFHLQPIEDKEPTAFQTFLKDCDCKGGGVLIRGGVIHCRWCRKPYAKGGMINYSHLHFPESQSIPAGKGTANETINEEMRIGKDNVCPITKEQCDDECCPPGAICNLSHEGGSPPTANDIVNAGDEFVERLKKKYAPENYEPFMPDNPVLDRQDKWTREDAIRGTIESIGEKILGRQDKKERIGVTSIVQIKETALNSKEPNITFYLNQFVPVSKHEELKQAIEQVLNDEDKIWKAKHRRLFFAGERMYRGSDLNKAFDSAHLMKGDRYVYNTFEDYKNSLT